MIPKKPALGLDPRVDPGFWKRSCSNNKLKRDGDSKKSHRASEAAALLPAVQKVWRAYGSWAEQAAATLSSGRVSGISAQTSARPAVATPARPKKVAAQPK